MQNSHCTSLVAVQSAVLLWPGEFVVI